MPDHPDTSRKREQRRKATLRKLKEALVVITSMLGAVKLLVEIVKALLT